MRYTVYSVVNLITKEYYIGVRLLRYLDDKYLGSGLRIVRSVKKYGKNSFVRTTLHEFDSAKEAFEMEKHILRYIGKDPKCLNLAEGGRGGPNFKGKKHTLESIEKSKRNRPKSKPWSEETKVRYAERRREKNGGNYFSNETKEKLRQVETSEETRRKISEGMRKSHKDHKFKSYERTPEFRKRFSLVMKQVYANIRK